MREAIGHEIDLITRELVTDIARSGAAEQYSSTDIGLLADLIVSFVVTMAERLVDGPRLRGAHARPGPHPAADAAGRRAQLALARAGAER